MYQGLLIRVQDELSALLGYEIDPSSLTVGFASRYCPRWRCSITQDDSLCFAHMLDMARKAVSKTRRIGRDVYDSEVGLRAV